MNTCKCADRKKEKKCIKHIIKPKIRGKNATRRQMNKRSKTVNSIHAISDCRAQIRMKPRQLTENSNNQVKKKKKKSHTSN